MLVSFVLYNSCGGMSNEVVAEVMNSNAQSVFRMKNDVVMVLNNKIGKNSY